MATMMTMAEINGALEKLADNYELRHNKNYVAAVFLAVQRMPNRSKLMRRLEDVLRIQYDNNTKMHFAIN